jgi:hypothetical protein
LPSACIFIRVYLGLGFIKQVLLAWRRFTRTTKLALQRKRELLDDIVSIRPDLFNGLVLRGNRLIL